VWGGKGTASNWRGGKRTPHPSHWPALISSLYFTVVVFASVGLGDIFPRTDGARLVVMAQVILDLIFIALVAHLLIGVVQRRIGGASE
jgi:hypothetical protein